MTERKKCGKERGKNQKGITLIALVITIVILIILSTVAINAVLGENGLIKQAEKSKDIAEESKKNEEMGMTNAVAYMNEILGGTGGNNPDKPEVPAEWDLEKVTPVLSEDNKYVPVPKGFKASTIEGEKSVNDGFVIKQGSNGAATTGVNEFVWIPVNDESLAKMYNTTGGEKQLLGVTTKTNIYSNLRQRSEDSYTITTPGNNPEGIREPDVLSSYDTDSKYYNTILKYGSTKDMADKMVAEYSKTYESIKKYDGFYIGRYEITGSVDSPTVQKEGTVITSQNWYNLKKACTNVVSTQYAQSTMIYGNQWDEVMEWLKTKGYDTDTDSSSWGNYSDYNTKNGYEEGNPKYVAEAGGKQTAGFSKYWQANNIYDLAGNCYEWTQEANNTNSRVYRGRWLRQVRFFLSCIRPRQHFSG